MLYSDFVKCADHFLKISDLTNDGWTLEKYKDHVYLAKSMTQWLEIDKEDTFNELYDFTDKSSWCDEELEDDQTVNESRLKIRKWQYHVLHSFSYQIPVIYFNVWDTNGQLLSLDELCNAVRPNFKEYLVKNKWYTLTQQEHPYLFKPFFHFHPCHTEDFLNSFAHSNYNSLITWLSSIGQVIWLNLNSEYGKMCSF